MAHRGRAAACPVWAQMEVRPNNRLNSRLSALQTTAPVGLHDVPADPRKLLLGFPLPAPDVAFSAARALSPQRLARAEGWRRARGVLRQVGVPSSGAGSADLTITLSPLAEAEGFLCDHHQTPGPELQAVFPPLAVTRSACSLSHGPPPPTCFHRCGRPLASPSPTAGVPRIRPQPRAHGRPSAWRRGPRPRSRAVQGSASGVMEGGGGCDTLTASQPPRWGPSRRRGP